MIIKKSVSNNNWYLHSNYDSIELNDYFINITIDTLNLKSTQTYEVKYLDQSLKNLILIFLENEKEKAQNKIEYINYLNEEIK